MQVEYSAADCARYAGGFDFPVTFEVTLENEEELLGMFARMVFSDHKALVAHVEDTEGMDFDAMSECEELAEFMEEMVNEFIVQTRS